MILKKNNACAQLTVLPCKLGKVEDFILCTPQLHILLHMHVGYDYD